MTLSPEKMLPIVAKAEYNKIKLQVLSISFIYTVIFQGIIAGKNVGNSIQRLKRINKVTSLVFKLSKLYGSIESKKVANCIKS
jgi:hypothetical protein